MNNKSVLFSTLLTSMVLPNYSYGEEVTDEFGDKKIIDSAIIRDNSNGTKRKNALAAGYRATTDADETVVLGDFSTVHNPGSTAVGVKVDVYGDNATAIGNYTKAEKNKSVALGAYSKAIRPLDVMTEVFSNKTVHFPGEVSIGAGDTHLRQITHVAGGTEDTDAVNVRQIKALENKIQTASGDYDAKAGTALDKTQQHETMASTYATNAKIALDTIRDYGAKAETAFEFANNSSQFAYSGAHQVRELVGQLQGEISYIGRMAKQAPDGIIYIGHDLEENSISVAGKQGDRVLTGVADGIRDNDAANIAQLNRV